MRRVFLALLFALPYTLANAAASDPKYNFAIPLQRGDTALNTFAQQADITVLFPYDVASAVMANPVFGRFTLDEALDRLFRGTGLRARIDAQGTLVLERVESSARTEPGPGKRGLLRSLGEALRSLAGGSAAATGGGGQERGGPTPVPIEEITVTGSRIRVRSGMETPTPVTAVNADVIATLAPGNLVDALSLMPQFLNNSGPGNIFTLAGAAGSSFLNLRGVGSNRTLVLLDGRRVASSNRLGVADVATFPEAIVRGVEVVTGGASAAYGSDAVSGVVNFLLDTDFTGLKGHVQGGITSRGDNGNVELSLAGGRDLGARTHVLASIDYFAADKVETYQGRDWYRSWGTVDSNGPGQPVVVLPDVRSRLYTAGGLIRQPGSALDMLNFVAPGVAVPFHDGTVVGTTRQQGGTGYYGDIASKEQDQTGQGSLYPEVRRGSVFLYLDTRFNDAWQAYAQLIRGWNDANFNAQGAHQEGDAWQATIYADNAFLPAGIRDVMIAEGLASFGFSRFASRQDLARARAGQENDFLNYTAGFKGEFEAIHVQAYYQYGQSDSRFTAIDFPRLDRLYRATDAVVNPANGVIVCRSTLAFPDDGCVPANLFGPGAPSAAAIAYILDGDMWWDSRLRQHFAELSLEADIHSGWGAGPVTLAGGASYRADSMRQVPEPAAMVALDVPPADTQGYRGLPANFVGPLILQFSGVGDTPIRGRFDVAEVFAEALVPLVRGRRLIEALDLSAAIRYADYAGSGGVVAWKLGIDWRLTDSLRLRATRSRDTRAATLAERFDRSGGGATAFDPALNRTYSFSQIIGGNPAVEPELADTWTAGLVLQPVRVPGLSLSADWYDVKIKDYIAQLGVQRIIDDCFAGAAALCDRIARNAVGDQITLVENVFLNVAQARVSGVDLEAAYRTPVHLFHRGGEELGLRAFASYLAENSFTNPGVPKRDDAGTTLLPEWTATGIVQYRNGPFALSLTGRYIDHRVQFSDPVPTASRLDDNTVDAVFYTSLRLSHRLDSDRLGTHEVFLNVSNLFDVDPPVVATWTDFFGASAFPPGIHDTLGRRFIAGVEFEF